jgi:glucokinase
MTPENIAIFNKERPAKTYAAYVIGGDIGGTNTNLCVAGIKNTSPNLLFSMRFKTSQLNSLLPAMKEVLCYAEQQYAISVKHACIGVAGVVSDKKDYARLTNASWDVNAQELSDNTSLQHIVIINDFQAAGFGINLLDNISGDTILVLRKGQSSHESGHKTKIILGPGTGLGKSILVYNPEAQIYVPIPSEGGHSDFPPYDEDELSMVHSIKKQIGIKSPLSYEELLSGRGLAHLYSFIRGCGVFPSTEYTDKIDGSHDKAPLISEYRTKDQTCNEIFRRYACYFARCAKNFVLDTLATGGLYIYGGIAVKNRQVFQSAGFFAEFERAFRRTEVLQHVPIYLVLNYDIGFKGACLAAIYYFKL